MQGRGRGRGAATKTPSRLGFKEESQVSPTVSCLMWSHTGDTRCGHQASDRKPPPGAQAEGNAPAPRLPRGTTCTGKQSEETVAFGRAISGAISPPHPQTGQPTSLPSRQPGCLSQEAANHPAALMKLPRNWLISLFDYFPLIPFLEQELSKNRALSVYLSIPCA